MTFSRRQVLGLLAAAAARPAFAFGERTALGVAELDLGPGTVQRPSAWDNVLYELERTTAVVARRPPASVPVTLSDPELFEYPFLVLSGDGAFTQPTDQEAEQLARFLSYGGFLFIDDASAGELPDFDASVRTLMQRIFPTRPLAPLPRDHSVFRTFFLMTRISGRVERATTFEGITVGNVAPVIYGQTDIGGALERLPDGRHARACTPRGNIQRYESSKLAVNLVMYSLTANYKKDQVQVRELLREGRLRWDR